MLKTLITDREGRYHASVGREGTLNTVVHPHPPIGETLTAQPFVQYFTDDGSALGSEDMRANGATTSPVNYSIKAVADNDIYIKSINVVISDAGAALNEFGSIAALNNGINLEWFTQDQGLVIIQSKMQSNWDFIRLSGGRPAFGSGANSFRANNVSGLSEGYIPQIDFQQVFGLPWGLRLRAGTSDCLRFVIRDNITGIDEFNAIGYGIKI